MPTSQYAMHGKVSIVPPHLCALSLVLRLMASRGREGSGQRHTDRQLPSVRFFYAVELARPEDVIPDFIPGEADACLCNAFVEFIASIANLIAIDNNDFGDTRGCWIPKQQPRFSIWSGFFGCVAKTGVDELVTLGGLSTRVHRTHSPKQRLDAVAGLVEKSDLSQIQDRKLFLRGVFKVVDPKVELSNWIRGYGAMCARVMTGSGMLDTCVCTEFHFISWSFIGILRLTRENPK